ncbi:MAG: translational GTPase TypA [Proteobacteria bacterium]|nr:translational GTPase TypA [Pseudomonadota bacterium]MBU4470529.1 translational GTPase TypA [Pseudomonadota bacterium]MCG2751365.1 translational GTPase TypA [Desulfobacteraceae bacterium]
MKNKVINNTIRNIAIIAHVDHGKTTLVDAMFKQRGVFRAGSEVEERVMDNMDLERERGITIAAKNCSVTWNDVKINIIDTPGHADFSGEVERALSMVDGAVLLVDASEGPLPQTRFVLKKTLEKGHKVVVVINKIDRKDARPNEILDEIYDLFIDLGADDAQLDFPYLYAIGREGVAKTSLEEEGHDLEPLFEMIIKEIPGPEHDPAEPFQMLVSDLGYSDYLGRLAIGKISNGTAQFHETMVRIDESGNQLLLKILKLQVYDGVKLKDTNTAEAGDIVVLSGMEDMHIGDTICTKEFPKPLPRITVDEPTISMEFTINTSPLSGKEGKIIQSNKIRERLMKESLKNVAVKFEETEDRERFIVKGRGEFQMAILIETMRREGFEVSVGRPNVIFKYKGNERLEPIETLYVDCGEEFLGIVTEKLSIRKGRLTHLENNGSGRVRAEFSVPSRALIGYRDEFLTDTKGTGIMNTLLSGYEPFRGDFPSRFTGSLVSDRNGICVAYALFHLEPRGRLLVAPGEQVYEGMIVGEHNKGNDLDVNPTKEKKLTNMRASGKDEAMICSPIKPMTLERAIHLIKDDEMVEVTPKSIRLHKRVLSSQKRHMIKGADRK